MADPSPPSADKTATAATPTPTAAPTAGKPPGKPDALKKGALVRLNLQAYRGSLEAAASPPEPPGYVLEGPGEILVIKGDYAQIRWRRPVPDVWLRLDQLESWSA